MFSMFKKEERKEIYYEQDEFNEEEEIGILIHYTSVAVYMYLCLDGRIENEDVLNDAAGREIIVQGNTISIVVESPKEITEIIEQYGLNNMNLPLFTIDVTLY
ncbi:hypothetical protein SAMN05518871_102189 [Psychrobacillus sp. OK028]|uniref:hypothetical protein n=1 Tax=Psychrobacillus sp. OK028 TaxID=1884359 RepID=UPI00087FBA72|nr:hypothetical protein [Psychrobacillus sp. OK028]SDM76437.1 hypothetical protein SAMN05518871_102189 [Psychrobacillus sp. OK028]